MTKHDWFIDLGYEIAQATQKHFMPQLQATVEAAPWDWGDLHRTRFALASPEPFNADMLATMAPYSPKSAHASNLEGTAGHGLIEAVDGGYRITEQGRDVLARMDDIMDTTSRALEGAVGGQASDFADAVGRIAAACAESGECATPNLTMSQRAARAEAPVLEQARRQLNNIYAFRDDAHQAAWQQHDVDGHAWEAFTHIWGRKIWADPVSTAAEAAEKFSFRGYNESDYAAALDGLVERGWLSKDGDTYSLTEQGKSLREATEDETDRLFFSSWGLDEAGGAELRGRMERLRDALNKAEVVAPA